MKKLVLLALAALIMLLGLGVAGLAWVSRSVLGADPVWVAVRKAPPQFHVKASATALQFREEGFQDPHYELLFEVDDVDAFLSVNHLTRGAPEPPMIDDAPVKPTSTVELQGFEQNDSLAHSGQLWSVGAKTYVYLVAFGS